MISETEIPNFESEKVFDIGLCVNTCAPHIKYHQQLKSKHHPQYLLNECALHMLLDIHTIFDGIGQHGFIVFFLFSFATPVATTDDNEKNDSFAFSVCHNIKSSRNFYFFVNKYLFEFFGFDFGLTQTANRSIIRGEFGEYAAMQKYEVK